MGAILGMCAGLVSRMRGVRARSADHPRAVARSRTALGERALTPDDPRALRLSLEGDVALRLIIQGVDLAQAELCNTDVDDIGGFLAPLTGALAGGLPRPPDSQDWLELTFDHSRQGCSALTSIDSISDLHVGLKVALVQALCGALEGRSDSEIARVAGPALEVLTRNPSYLERHPRLAARLMRAGILAVGDAEPIRGFLEHNPRALRLAARQALEELRRDWTGMLAIAYRPAIELLLELLERAAQSDCEDASSSDIRSLRRAHERRLAGELRALCERRPSADPEWDAGEAGRRLEPNAIGCPVGS